jgi:hypothetical protein
MLKIVSLRLPSGLALKEKERKNKLKVVNIFLLAYLSTSQVVS